MQGGLALVHNFDISLCVLISRVQAKQPISAFIVGCSSTETLPGVEWQREVLEVGQVDGVVGEVGRPQQRQRELADAAEGSGGVHGIIITNSTISKHFTYSHLPLPALPNPSV